MKFLPSIPSISLMIALISGMLGNSPVSLVANLEAYSLW